MPYTTEEMLDDFRKDVARLTAENAKLRAACEKALTEMTYGVLAMPTSSQRNDLSQAAIELQAAIAGEVTK